jgi:hypothetical protein
MLDRWSSPVLQLRLLGRKTGEPLPSAQVLKKNKKKEKKIKKNKKRKKK